MSAFFHAPLSWSLPARIPLGIPTDRLVWEMLVAGLRPDAHRGAAASVMLGYAGGVPVAEISEVLAASDLEAWPAAPEALVTAAGLVRLPMGARIHLTTVSPCLASLLKNLSSSDLPMWLRNRLTALLTVRWVVVESVEKITPRMNRLLQVAKAALSYARPLAEIEVRMAAR